MSKDILNLKPALLWKNFYNLTQIPRPSKHEDKVQDFLVQFGKNLGLETIKDEVGNVIIRKPATPGMENRKGVVLQGHMDMVPQKNNDTQHDFEKDPIVTYIDNGWVKARGTTLGADNGLGVAAAMAVLESKDIQHGPVEAFITTDEETGMTGAMGIKPGVLKGDILLNLDTEEEGELYIGCAGGTNGNFSFTFKPAGVPAAVEAFRLTITGLKGGHSGVDIHLERGNSIKVLTRVLWEGSKHFGLRLASLEGGSLRNAIPREGSALIVIPVEFKDAFIAAVADLEKIIRKELSAVEPTMKIFLTPAQKPDSLIDEVSQRNIINALYACPNGVIRMSNEMPGLVETSINIGVLKTENNMVLGQTLLRSSVDSAKLDLQNMVDAVFTMAGADITMDGEYPGWKPDPDSAILKLMLDLYKKMFGKEPMVKAIHAGLECGILGGPYPNWDMISVGPTIVSPHSPDEKTEIESVRKFWDYLVETLKNIPQK
ncbi:MAG: aminoacyl-histidine dipeptidase [Bacteroidetes bacterium]|nr:aminoacyl-histidine dipeptidase [Bacteroidota bacterium]